MKKIITMLMLILSTLSFADKKLYVGTNAEFKPYEYLENNKMVGFDIELMELLGKELGYEIKWQDMSFDGLLPALQMKKIDAVIIAEVSGNEYLKTMKGIKKIDTIKDKLPSASIAFRKADAKLAKEFSDAILKIKDSPEYAKLVEKYFPEHYDNFIANQKKK